MNRPSKRSSLFTAWKDFFHLAVHQFLNICGYLCQLVQWLSCCNVCKRICLECTVAKSGIRISLFHSSSSVLHGRLLRNLIVSWHLIPAFQTAFDVTRTVIHGIRPRSRKYALPSFFHYLLALCRSPAHHCDVSHFVELTREASEAPSTRPSV